MRNSILLVGGAAVLVGVGLIAHPGEHTSAGSGIVVVRGGAQVTAVARAVPIEAAVGMARSPATAIDANEDFEDPGIWATPADFDQPEQLH